MDRGSARPDGAGSEPRRLILNPVSGDGDHVDPVRRLARSHGISVVETERAGHGAELAKQAADEGVELLAICGGDGTVHEAVQGLAAADALDAVTLAVVPAGTANILASGLGVESVREGFEVAVDGESRQLDLAVADGEPFVLSAVAGLPAKASAAASSDLKRRIGELAFVVEAVQEAREFDGLTVAIEAETGDGERIWSGEALSLLVGNHRRLTGPNDQADAEDGALDVVIVEEMPPASAITEVVERRLFDRETPHVTELRAERVDVRVLGDETVTLSLDGEIRSRESVSIAVRSGALRVRVGDEYVPRPQWGTGR